VIALDTETDASPDQNFVVLALCESGHTTLHDHTTAEAATRRALEGSIVAHNAAFDVGVLVRAFPALREPFRRALEADRVWCTQIREELIGIAGSLDMQFRLASSGKVAKRSFGLDALLQRYLGTAPLDKGADGWRLRFGELLGLPLAAWPQRAKDYARGDVEHLEALIRAQKKVLPNAQLIGSLRVSPDEAHQVRAAVALGELAHRGLAPNPRVVSYLRQTLENKLVFHNTKLKAAGLLHARVKKRPEDLSLNKKACQAAVELGCETLGIDVPMTAPSKTYPGGQVSTSRETLELLAEATPSLQHYFQRTHCTKMIQTYLRPAEAAIAEDRPVRARYHSLKETGRTSSSGPNIQNLPRLAGMREVYQARPGHALIACDYDTAELRALAQVQLDFFGSSKFADFYQANPDGDPHCLFAAKLLGEDYETLLAAHQSGTLNDQQSLARSSAKGMNFGAPGGLGARALVSYLKGYGVEVTEERARSLLADWKTAWSMKLFFDWVNRSGPVVTQPRSGRVRGGTSYCSRANTVFQGLIADAAKEALWLAYSTRTPSWHPWAFIHDEIIIEVPLEEVHQASQWLEELMIRGAKKRIPDIPITVGSHAMFSWCKKAKRVLDSKARLIPDPSTFRFEPAYV